MSIPKEILDFVVVPSIAYFYFDVNMGVLIAFFIAKWFHLCDSFYNIFRYILTNQPTSEWGYWRWWTPLGLLRTNFWGYQIINGYTEADLKNKTGAFKIKKDLMSNFLKPVQNKAIHKGVVRGIVSIREAWIQTGCGIGLATLLSWLMG